MTGFDVLKKAALRIGMNNGKTILVGNDLHSRNAEFLNQIARDLKLGLISDLSRELSFKDAETEALCCGVAMLLSISEGDKDLSELYSDIYNSKRASVLAEASKIKDVLPIAESGDD